MKRVSFFILFAFASMLCSCEPAPIGPVHIRIEANTAPGNQPVPGAHFILMGFIKSSSYDQGPYELNEYITLTTNSKGEIDTMIYSNSSLFYSLQKYYQSPEGYLTTFDSQNIDKAGSYTYYVGYNYPAYLNCHLDFDQLASNNMSFTIFSTNASTNLVSYPNNLLDTTFSLKMVSGSQINKFTVWWPKPLGQLENNTSIYYYANVAPFDTLDVFLTEP